MTGEPRRCGAAALRYRVEHETCYDYTAPVSQSWQLARLKPRDLAWQRLLSHSLEIDPQVDERHESPDAYANSILHFALHRAHRMLRVRMSCCVEVGTRDWQARTQGLPWRTVRDTVLADPTLDRLNAARMTEPTRLVPLSVIARDYAAQAFTEGADWFEGVLTLMQAIHRDFEFQAGATTVSTAVDDVMRERRGVCQDFAHVMLAGLRGLGLPARYVSGYLLTDPPPDQPRLMGVDATHAWVAAYAPHLGWVEFDPTNNQLADQRYITLAWGADFADVVPLRGVILGGGEQQMEVRVSVMPA